MARVRRLRRPLVKEDFERMNLPRELWTVKIQQVPESVRDLVERYLIRFDDMAVRGAGMLLTGPSGVGKTCIGALVAKGARSCGYTTYFSSVWELRECVRSRVMFSDDLSVLDRCRTVDCLILDGLCEEDGKERFFGSRAVEELVTFRGSHQRVTIVTSQMGLREFNGSFPGFIQRSQGCAVLVPVQGPDQRRDKNEDLRKAIFDS